MKQLFLIISVLFSFSCFGTQKTIPKSVPDNGWYFPNVSHINPGDTVVVTGDYDYAYLFGLHGTASAKITILTLTDARFGTDGSYGLILENCSHLIIDGRANGVAGRLKFGPASGTYIPQTLTTHNSTFVEVRYVEVSHGQVGIMARPATGADIDSLYLHDNVIHDIRGQGSAEAFYIGNTSKTDTTSPRFKYLQIINNNCYDLGGDGIQVCNAPNFVIRGNTVTDFGKQPNIGTHCTGILLGGNAWGIAHFNIVNTGRGSGMQILGYGTVTVEDNQFINTGTGYGINPQGVQIVEQPDAIYISKRGGVGSAPLRTVLSRNVIVGAARYGVFNDGNFTTAGVWNCNTVSGAGVASYQSNVGDVITMVSCSTPTPVPPVSTTSELILRGTFFIQL